MFRLLIIRYHVGMFTAVPKPSHLPDTAISSVVHTPLVVPELGILLRDFCDRPNASNDTAILTGYRPLRPGARRAFARPRRVAVHRPGAPHADGTYVLTP